MKPKIKRPLRGGPGSWRWGVCLTFRRWINHRMHMSGIQMNDVFAFKDTLYPQKTFVLNAETIVSALIDAGENDDRTAAVIHEGITGKLKRKEPMRRILEHLGASLIESGALAKDGKSVVKHIDLRKEVN